MDRTSGSLLRSRIRLIRGRAAAVAGMLALLTAPVPAAGGRKPWQPRPATAGAKTRAYRCRIVSYAGKWTRHGLGNYMAWRYPNGPLAPRRDRDGLFHVSHVLDVDGDGRTDDDYVASLPFSLTEPLSNPDWPMHMAFPQRRSSRFYGGVSWYVSNSTPKQSRFWVEMGYNPDHSPPWYDGRAEDHPLQGQANEKKADSFHRHYWAILWRKDDFLNGGDRGRVTFDETSRLASITARDYWLGYDDVRMVVLEGPGGDSEGAGQLYISDNKQFDIPTSGYKPARGRVFLLRPTEATWAKYEPRGQFIHFDADRARFAKRDFRDVRAVGWYLAKNTLKGKQSHLKWYGFEADAIVRRPVSGSVNVGMVEVPACEGVPRFRLAACELPYAKWKDIYRYGDAPFHTLEPRYVYRKDGDMGSMLFGRGAHGPDEPATNLTWYDALAICNTLSEMEGKTPCYYVDGEFREVFRNLHVATRAIAPRYERRNVDNPTFQTVPPPRIHVKWGADGHRLPTPAEWLAAHELSRQGAGADEAWTAANSGGRTHPVGIRKANALGVYDMIGNVWELCWPFGEVYDPNSNPVHLAMGGSFLNPTDPTAPESAASPYGDRPYEGSGAIGLRLVCRDAGLGAPKTGPAPKRSGFSMIGPVPAWAFRKGDRSAARGRPARAAEPLLDMVELPGGSFTRRRDMTKITVSPLAIARTHTTYDQWKRVLQWADAKGYSFSRTGDMGSMYYFEHRHSPNEPVTNVTWHDMLVWCNALSEMEGRRPCHYTDEACTEVYREAFAYRPLKVSGPQLVSARPHRYSKYSHLLPQPWIFTRWDADGYRLATEAEFEYALRGGTDTPYFWGGDEAARGAHVWHIGNAGGRTHEVGLKKPNPFGLYDVQGNAFHWLFSCDRKRVRTRPHELDTKNPKASPYWAYKQPKEVYSRLSSALIAGGSWLCGGFNVNGPHGVAVSSQNIVNTAFCYADLSFRVVRCKAGTHPRDGLEKMEDRPVVLKIDPAGYDRLEGAAYRGSLLRTGVHETRGPARAPGVKWAFDTGGRVRSSPVMVKGVVYVGSDGGHFHAIDAATGAEQWRLPVRGGVTGSACLSGGAVYFGGNDGRLYAVDAATGQVRWKAAGRGAMATSPAVAFGVVFVEGCWGFEAAGGRCVWQTASRAMYSPNDGRKSSLALRSGSIYHYGSVLDIATARYAVGRGDPWAGQNCDAVVGNLLVTTNSGIGGAVNLPHVRVLDVTTGRVKWQKDIVLPGQSVNERKVLLCSPAVWEGKVYLGFDGGRLMALELTGKELWAFGTAGPIRSDPSISARDATVYFGCHDGHLYALNARTGALKWKVKTAGAVVSSPWPADGAVYVGCDDGKVYAVR